MAHKAGLSAIAITDHDTVAGIEEAMGAGDKLGVTVVPGVEISTVAGGQDIHILGYFMDYTDEEFLARLSRLRNTRDHRNEMMVERLCELGLEVSMDEVRKNTTDQERTETVGRPHIAEIMVKKGYVSSIKEAFELYLGKAGKAYVNPERIHPTQAVEWIQAAGGTAVIAHPGLYEDDALVEELISAIDGIEVYHSDHSVADEARYLELARKYNLIVTAGSDFHGARAGEVFHGSIGSKRIEVDVIEQLRK